MSEYLITGAFGTIGASLVRRLAAEGRSVTALVRPSSDPWRLRDLVSKGGVKILRADLNEEPSVRLALAQAGADVVIHSAWDGVTGAARNDTAQITNNIRAALNLFEAAKDSDCRTFVGLGSQAEYGTAYTEARTESMPPCPETAYGVAKTCVQQATETMARLAGMRYLWFRIFSVYGPQDDERHMMPTLVRALLRGERPALTPGEQIWDYLYVDDVADAVVAGIQRQNCSGVFNLASGEAHRLRSVVEQIRDRIDPQLPLGFGDVPYRHDQVMRLEADVSRLTNATGWRPGVPLEDGLGRAIAYCREYPPHDPEGRRAE